MYVICRPVFMLVPNILRVFKSRLMSLFIWQMYVIWLVMSQTVTASPTTPTSYTQGAIENVIQSTIVDQNGIDDIQLNQNVSLYPTNTDPTVSTNMTNIKDICYQWELKGCRCYQPSDGLSIHCRGVNLVKVPSNLPYNIVKLDLGHTNITELPNGVFKGLNYLEELILADNRLVRIDNETFVGMNKLKRLSLQNCGLSVIPSDALKPIKSLTTLNMGRNKIFRIEVNDLPSLDHLVILLLKKNRIESIDNGTFSNLQKLKVLELDENFLTEIPHGLSKLTNLQEFTINGNKIRSLERGDLPKGLISLEFRGNPLMVIKSGALHNMSQLRKLVLSDTVMLKDFPSLEGCGLLEILRVDRASLTNTPSDLCLNSPLLKSLELKSNKLRTIPELHQCKNLRVIDLAGNKIDSLHGKPFRGLGQLYDLMLSYNEISFIPYDAFFGLTKLQLLDLEGNGINFIHSDAFSVFRQLEDLNLGNNVFPHLPVNGLERLLHLKTFNNPKLREFPAPAAFPRIQTLMLSYAYHCCAFLPLLLHSATDSPPPFREAVIFPTDNDFDLSLWNNSHIDIWPQLQNLSKKFGSQISGLMDSFGQDFVYPSNLPAYLEEYFEEDGNTQKSTDIGWHGRIKCLPLPGPFLPCQDLFDWWTLRCGVWIVFLMAMLGNGTVVFVLIFSRSKMDVPRFLVCNLAAADFFMGIYLGLLAVVDASTLGEFRMFAIPWQMSVGCQLAGFLAVLSAELSVYTLAVITLERNYAITHAMHLNKRLSLKHAAYIMAIGWLFSLTMALLPLFGISDYRKFAVCLPFETTNGPLSKIYVVFLMFINGVAFIILMGCYLKMYCAIRGSQAWNSNDSRIAKRMALLVFTDFLCWSPIAFLSLTAIFGLQLISLEQAKIFTVFILPLNSCCNPFLYAILTKQFKKDCVLICKAIEESRVSRGIGRCRHSSNFSNRQTPGNTNSLADRSSKELPPLLSGPTCPCTKLLESELTHHQQPYQHQGILSRALGRILSKNTKRGNARRDNRSDQYAYQIAQIQQKQYKRAGSVSSENFSSSRSDSWRHGQPHHCGIPLRILDPRRRHSSWLITRKTSQDSNLSNSRNDSSTSGTTASTSTFRMSRSSAGSATPLSSLGYKPTSKPRLVRQHAVQEECSNDSEKSPPRLSVRFLPTIPSAADSSLILEDDSHVEGAAQYYTIFQGGNTVTTLSNTNEKPP